MCINWSTDLFGISKMYDTCPSGGSSLEQSSLPPRMAGVVRAGGRGPGAGAVVRARPQSQLVCCSGTAWLDVGLQQLSASSAPPALISALQFTPDQQWLHFTQEFSIFYFLSPSTAHPHHITPPDQWQDKWCPTTWWRPDTLTSRLHNSMPGI